MLARVETDGPPLQIVQTQGKVANRGTLHDYQIPNYISFTSVRKKTRVRGYSLMTKKHKETYVSNLNKKIKSFKELLLG